MNWSISKSISFSKSLSVVASVENHLLAASGLNLELIDVNGDTVWKRDMPFRVHAAEFHEGYIGILSGHGYYVLQAHNGELLSDGRSTPGGFSDLMPRPGGGWVISDRKGQIHIFDERGRGIRRLKSGSIRRFVGWFDREHLLWQDGEGHLRCARLANQDLQRVIEERIWSWVSRLYDGRCLLLSSDGSLWEGVPHPYGWDELMKVDNRSIEPMDCCKTGDGWWILSVDGSLVNLSGNDGEESLNEEISSIHHGDGLINIGQDRMVTWKRSGLLKFWNAPHLITKQNEMIQKMAMDARISADWEERRKVFDRAREAEDQGRLSLALDLYKSLGRDIDVQRITVRMRGQYETN